MALAVESRWLESGWGSRLATCSSYALTLVTESLAPVRAVVPLIIIIITIYIHCSKCNYLSKNALAIDLTSFTKRNRCPHVHILALIARFPDTYFSPKRVKQYYNNITFVGGPRTEKTCSKLISLRYELSYRQTPISNVPSGLPIKIPYECPVVFFYTPSVSKGLLNTRIKI
jgi:hypothetical protein